MENILIDVGFTWGSPRERAQGLGVWEDFRKPKQESACGLEAFEDLDMFNHQVFKNLIPVL